MQKHFPYQESIQEESKLALNELDFWGKNCWFKSALKFASPTLPALTLRPEPQTSFCIPGSLLLLASNPAFSCVGCLVIHSLTHSLTHHTGRYGASCCFALKEITVWRGVQTYGSAPQGTWKHPVRCSRQGASLPPTCLEVGAGKGGKRKEDVLALTPDRGLAVRKAPGIFQGCRGWLE